MDKAAVIVIDVQQEYFAPLGKLPLPGGPKAIEALARVLAWARARHVPVIHVVHENQRPNPTIFIPGSPALAIHPVAAPRAAEPVVTKHMPGSFTGTALEDLLRKEGVERVIIGGFMTQMCVDTTARQAAHRGFKVIVLSDATAAMDVKAPDGALIPHDQVHRTHLGSLSGFLADIRSTDQVTVG